MAQGGPTPVTELSGFPPHRLYKTAPPLREAWAKHLGPGNREPGFSFSFSVLEKSLRQSGLLFLTFENICSCRAVLLGRGAFFKIWDLDTPFLNASCSSLQKLSE